MLNENTKGTVYLVGAGCGDYDLITLRGMALLKQCDVVVYDSLIDSRLLDFVPTTAEKISVGKRCGHHSETQETINHILVAKAKEGKDVVRLKGGDPFVFGRGGEEILQLQQHHIRYDIVPGISSAIAVPELSGIPVTHRQTSRSVHIITGHTTEDFSQEKMKHYAQLDGTLVFLMGLKHLNEISSVLTAYGKDSCTPVAVIASGASSMAKTVRGTLADIYQKSTVENIQPPCVIVVGKTAEFDFLPTVEKPLTGKKIIATGTPKFVSKLSLALEQKGAVVQRLAHLQVVAYDNNPLFDSTLENLSFYGIIVLTSINGADIFLKRLSALKTDIRKLSAVRFAVIGRATAKVLQDKGIFPEIIPENYTSQALAEAIVRHNPKKEKVLILRAQQGSACLTEILDVHHIPYDEIKLYDVIARSDENQTMSLEGDYITFASSSGVKHFFSCGYRLPDNSKVVCIGDVTAQTLRKYNIKGFSVSRTSDTAGIVETIIEEKKNETIQTLTNNRNYPHTGA